MTIKERVQLIIAELRISQSKFEDAIGASRGAISHLDERISSKLARKIVAKYPQVNIEWVRTGKGSMFLSIEQENKPATSNYNTSELLNEIEKQRRIIARFQMQIERAQDQINICQEHINVLLNTLTKDL